jgi:hypothetical protein
MRIKASDVQDHIAKLEEYGYGIRVEHEMICGDAVTRYHFGREVWTNFGTYSGLDWGCIKVTNPIAGVIAKRTSVTSYFSPWYTDKNDRSIREAYQSEERNIYKARA